MSEIERGGGALCAHCHHVRVHSRLSPSSVRPLLRSYPLKGRGGGFPISTEMLVYRGYFFTWTRWYDSELMPSRLIVFLVFWILLNLGEKGREREREREGEEERGERGGETSRDPELDRKSVV